MTNESDARGRHRPKVDLAAFKKDTGSNNDRRNRDLLQWLSCDTSRAELFEQINQQNSGRLHFPSRDSAPRHCDCAGIEAPLPKGSPEHKTVELITDRATIEKILLNKDRAYSSRIYAELGGGNFMLALDPGTETEPMHALQKQAFLASFPQRDEAQALHELAHRAVQSAAVLGLRRQEFDLAEFAEQAAVRFVQMLMGYALKDYALLQRDLRTAYRALVYQVMERHFVTDPTLVPAGKAASARLLARTNALIDAYANGDEDELKGTAYPERPHNLRPVLQKLGTMDGNLNGEQRAIIALGAAIGTVGNVQAAICIAVKALFSGVDSADDDVRGGAQARLDDVKRLAREGCIDEPSSARSFEDLKARLTGPLRENPPIPYLPRLKVDQNERGTGEEVLLALGGGTAGREGDHDDPMVWGLAETGPHWCLGQALAWPLIVETVRHVMALPGLAQGLDPENGEVKGLKKRNGFACESYPMTYRRDRRTAQTSLNVAMRIKAPVHENAERVREVIRSGAPRIEQALRASNHVHFAWFEMIESDTVLVLHTVYDGPFGAYLDHFALDAGDLFDVLFQYIEDPPPMPVGKFPREFAAHLMRYDRPPAMGYFFSAYPTEEVARIVRNQVRGR